MFTVSTIVNQHSHYSRFGILEESKTYSRYYAKYGKYVKKPMTMMFTLSAIANPHLSLF